MAELHALSGRMTIVLAAVVAAWAVLMALRGRVAGAAFRVALVVLFVGVTAGAVFGLILALNMGPDPSQTTGGPRDFLHWVYAAFALAAIPIVAVIAAVRPARQRPIVLAIGALTMLGLTARLLQTGS
jgi:hypothetical protein